jgi:hypothetical protein
MERIEKERAEKGVVMKIQERVGAESGQPFVNSFSCPAAGSFSR